VSDRKEKKDEAWSDVKLKVDRKQRLRNVVKRK
jgi:hypothetical protein